MAEVVGFASSIVALAVFASKSSSKLLHEIQTFHSLPRQVRELLTELSGLTSVLQTLSETGHLGLDIDLTALTDTLEQCRKACDGVEAELLTCCSRSGSDRASFRDWLKLKCGAGDGIEGFRQQLIGYKSIITVALSFANLRASAAGAEAIQACRDSIATTTVDLEAHLEDIQQKLEVLTRRTTASANPDAAVRHYMEGERLSTEKALQFCTLLSQQIEQIQVDFLNSGHAPQNGQDLGSTSGMIFDQGLEGCMHHMRFTLAHLEKRQKSLRERLGTGLMEASADAQASLDKLQHEAKTLRRGLEFCSDVDAYLESQISNIENHAEGNDTIQFMVSTDGRPINGSNHGNGDRLKQAGGHFGDASLQKVSQDFTSIALHQASSKEHGTKLPAATPDDETVPAGPELPFGSRHGPGFTLAKRSASSAPAGA